MEGAFTQSEKCSYSNLHTQTKPKSLFPLKQLSIPRNSNPSSAFSFWVSKSVKFLKDKAKVPNRVSSKRFNFDGMVVNNSVYCASPNHLESKMETLVIENEIFEGEKEVYSENETKVGSFIDLTEDEIGESSSSSNFLASEINLNDENSSSCADSSSSPPSMNWPLEKGKNPHCSLMYVFNSICMLKLLINFVLFLINIEIDMMKERFSKLLLGEDMSGCGNGVCTALAISNAITNLCATLFGQVWRLEPLPFAKKLMWRREMGWLLCVSDHIVMTSRPRSDLYINLPALRKLDNMLLEILDSFGSTEFWYVDQGIVASEANESSSFRKPLPRQEEKWWLPVPRVPPGGLTEDARKILQHRRDCTNQILKAAMAINSASLAEMDIPDSYLESLPKNGKSSLGDLIHRYINSDQFSPECLLDCLDLSSEHHALEIANRVEATVYVWRRRTNSKPLHSTQRSNSRSSWEMVKDLVSDADRRELLAERAESLLLCLKQRFPGLPQTTLDMSKIQYNKVSTKTLPCPLPIICGFANVLDFMFTLRDVGKSILESYSRVLESLAFNIVARIDDLLYVDDLSKHSDQLVTISKVGTITHKSVGIALPVPSTPYKTAFTTPNFSPAQLISPLKGDLHRSPYIESSKLSLRGFGVKRILTDYLSVDGKGKEVSNDITRLDSFSNDNGEVSVSVSSSFESSRCSKEAISRGINESVEDE
ncbi:hypothetical protein RD792_013995 [Penstemon davidsonii]|uniref:PRONE domain-containing protein n=1 Tax=Penstemon davidsonii TaxID=160366 RepID=A0ABR0CN43_9LAMI|nr:hypothetical protein RD792_013995 [Penstemon davidsonii]